MSNPLVPTPSPTPTKREYFLIAYLDSNGNLVQDSPEAHGEYSDNPLLLTNAAANIDLMLVDPDTDGDGQPDWQEIQNGTDPNDPASFSTSISGVVQYSGGQTGLIRVLASYEPDIMLRYAFDEDEGTIILDTSGHGRDGELYGAQYEPNGRIGGGLKLDGTNHYAELDGGLPLAGRSFTLAVWARPNASQQPCCESGRQDIFSTGVGEADQGLQFGYEYDGYFLVHFWDDDLFSTQSYTDDGQWRHWGATYDQATNERRLYRDGGVVGADTAADDFVGTGPLVIGRGAMEPFDVSYFGGVLDEVRAYDRAMSPTEMTNLFVQGYSALITYTAVVETAGSYSITNVPTKRAYYVTVYRDSNGNLVQETPEARGEYTDNPVLLTNAAVNIDLTLTDPDTDGDGMLDWWEILYGLNPTSGLSGNMVAWYRFNEGSGLAVSNAVSSAYTGSLYNASTTNWIQGYTGGSNDFSLWFDGVNDYVGIPQNPAIITQAPFSVSAWVWHDGVLAKRWGTVVSDSGWCAPRITGFLLRTDTNYNSMAFYVGCCTNYASCHRTGWKESYTG
ncbi:MAG: hypothetical protein KJ726_10370, partial [Verrucomicrobia bacterium]|nr:hypothetical protein [Verrucomicrobiota bacterium]